eukprot:6179842-Pleurochrysis_carterae.AAC.12
MSAAPFRTTRNNITVYGASPPRRRGAVRSAFQCAAPCRVDSACKRAGRTCATTRRTPKVT